MKIGAMTCCWNEEATIAYTIGSLVEHVDCYVVVDTGSTDKTLEILKSIFKKDIDNKRLIIIEDEFLEDFDISIPKNKAIQKLRDEGCESFIRLDGDDVFFDAGAQRAAKTARALPDRVTHHTINHWELYQTVYNTSLEWTDALIAESSGDAEPKFKCMRMNIPGLPRTGCSYGHARIYKTDGAKSMGKWTDEAWGLGPGEDIHNEKYKRVCLGNPDENIVHYGWARPMEKKLKKNDIWTHGKEVDIRVKGMEECGWETVDRLNMDKVSYGLIYHPRYVLFPFNKHPEVITRLAHRVREFFL